MKKIAYLLLFCILFEIIMPLNNVLALVEFNFESGNYHVVYVKASGTNTTCDNVSTVTYTNENLEYIKSFDMYDDALDFMKTLSSTSDKTVAIVGKRKDTDGNYVNKIIYSQYALVDLNTTGTSAITTNVYTSATNNNAYTYINGNGYFGGVDAAFIDYNNGTSRVKMKISGVTGWINSILSLSGKKYNGYDIVPLVAVKSPSYYYINDNGELVHRLSKKITASNCYSNYINLGPAPTDLASKDTNGNIIKYYSFDGNYFYTSLENMLEDYKNGSTNKSANVIPYYNYYMYMSVRANSNITADDLRNFLVSRGYTTEKSSALFGEELTFIDAQNKYGVNSSISFATAINESGWGTSSLAIKNNNLFGHNAYDSSVMESASKYNTVADCIYRHAYYYINTLFVETKDDIGRYNGGHLGNKNSGINVKYASDPYWGEKIAAIYYQLDNFSDLKDYGKHTIGIKAITNSVPIKKDANNSSKTLYNLSSISNNVSNIPVVILGEVEGESIDGNNIWYKIQTDAILINDRTEVLRISKATDLYDRNINYGYVHSSYITLLGENIKGIYIKKDGLFGLDKLSLNDDKTINIMGYLAITNYDTSSSNNITYDLILENQNTKATYEKSLNRILDSKEIPYTIPGEGKYSYEYSWFNGNISLNDIPQGDYSLYIRARSGVYESKEIISDYFSKKSINKFNDGERGYQFRTNYYLKTIPVELFIRDNGRIDETNQPSSNMFNQYDSLVLENGNLNIMGYSFNIGGDYSKNSNVSRKIIFEDINTFEKYEYDLGYIDNGAYQINLAVPDNYDKTRAWFNNSINIKDLKKGTYAIYIKTDTNVSDCAELDDIFFRKLDTTMEIDGKTFSLSINQNKRFRIELNVR